MCNIQTYCIAQTSTPINRTWHRPHCFPRAANGTSPQAEVSCASRQKGFPPAEIKNKQGYNIRQKKMVISYFRVCYCHYLSQEVIPAHHIPVPDLHSDSSLLSELLWIQLQLQSLSPVRETGLLDNLKPSRLGC